MSVSKRPSRKSLAEFAAELFQIQLHEVPRVSLMFAYSLMAVGAFVVGRILQDALLLTLPKADGKDMILALIGISAIVVSATTYVYSRFAHALRRDHMIMRINGVLAVLMFGVYLLMLRLPESSQTPVIHINYILIEVLGSLQVILFWTLASELFNPRSAKRSFAIIGGGAVMANLLAFGVRPMIALLGGAHHLLVLLVTMLVLCIWVVRKIGLQNEQELEQLFAQKKLASKRPATRHRQQIHMSTDSERIWTNKHLGTIALMIVVTYATSTIINYLFKAINADAFVNDRQGLANFLGLFYGISGIIACFVQFVLANRVLQKAGIRVALLLLPCTLLLGVGSLAMAPVLLSVFWASTLTKGSENVLRYTIYEVSVNLLYIPIDSRLRARAKAFIDGILKPSSVAASAGICAMLALGGWKQTSLAWLVIAFLCVWVVLVVRAHQEYVRTLIQSMQTRRLDLNESAFTIQDESAMRILREVLSHGQPEQILHALDLLPHVPESHWERELLSLLDHGDERIPIAALQMLERLEYQSRDPSKDGIFGGYEVLETESRVLEGRLYSLIEEGDAGLRAQAIETLCSLLQGDAVIDMIPYLEDDSFEVQSAAIVGLIRYGGLDGMLYAAEHLRQMLEHEDPEFRRYGAQIVGRLRQASFYRPLLPLLRDPAMEVRLCAIEAAGELGSPPLIKGLVEALSEPKTAIAAARSLTRFGPVILPHLEEVLYRHRSPEPQLAAIRVCRQLGGSASMACLAQVQHSPHREVREAALRGMQRILRREPHLQCDQALLHERFAEEMHAYSQWSTDHGVILRSVEHHKTLIDAVEERQDAILREAFLLLDLLYPGQQCELIYHHLHQEDPRLQANAIELLDNFLNQDHKAMLLPLLEDEITHTGQPLLVLPAPIGVVFARLSQDSSPWMHIGVLWTLLENGLDEYRELAEEALYHPEAVVRETACLVLREFASPEEYRDVLAEVVDDPSELVANYAQYQLQQLDANAPPPEA